MMLAVCDDDATGPESPNRPPTIVSEIPPESLAADGSVTLNVSVYFNDPDGDALTYSVVAHDPSIVRAFVSGPEVSLFGKNRGRPWVSETRVTITASDPGGLSANQEMGIMVAAGDVGFRDEFDSATLSAWHLTNASAEVDSGVLRLTSSSSGAGKAKRQLKAGMTDWRIRTRLVQARDSMTVSIVASTGTTPIQALALDIGPDVLVDGNATNYRLLFRHTGTWNVIGAGTYAPFDNVGNALEVAFFIMDGRIGFAVDGVTIRTEADVDFGAAGIELWVTPMSGAVDRQVLFEWVEVSGAVP